jgi:hypothetical protein
VLAEQGSGQDHPAQDALPSAESMLSIYSVNGATAPLVPCRLRGAS